MEGVTAQAHVCAKTCNCTSATPEVGATPYKTPRLCIKTPKNDGRSLRARCRASRANMRGVLLAASRTTIARRVPLALSMVATGGTKPANQLQCTCAWQSNSLPFASIRLLRC